MIVQHTPYTCKQGQDNPLHKEAASASHVPQMLWSLDYEPM